MIKLPRALRVAPYIFYVIALIMGVYHFGTNLWAIQTAGQSFDHLDPTGQDKLEWLAYLIASQPFAVGVSEAAYMAANGAIVHVLVAIYDKMKGPAT